MLPRVGKVSGTRVRVDAERLAHARRVHLGDLVRDVAVHARTSRTRRRVLPTASADSSMPASSSPCGRSASTRGRRRTARGARWPRGRPRRRCGGPRGCWSARPSTMAAAPEPRVSVANWASTSSAVASGPRAGRGCLLGVPRVLAVDDQRVVDLPGVDHRGGQLHPVDEAEAGVGDVEVLARRRQAERVVHCDRRGRLEVLPAHRGVDHEADPRRGRRRLGDRLATGHRRAVDEADALGPPAALVDAGEPLEHPGLEADPLVGRQQPLVDLVRGDHQGASTAQTASTEALV